MNDCDAVTKSRIIPMRMRIGFRHPAMGRPTSMRDANGPGETAMSFDRVFEHSNATDALDLIERAALFSLEDGDPSRVIASILESLESFEQDGGGIPMADIGDDSTHDERSPDLWPNGKMAKNGAFLPHPAAHAIDRSKKPRESGSENGRKPDPITSDAPHEPSRPPVSTDRIWACRISGKTVGTFEEGRQSRSRIDCAPKTSKI